MESILLRGGQQGVSSFRGYSRYVDAWRVGERPGIAKYGVGICCALFFALLLFFSGAEALHAEEEWQDSIGVALTLGTEVGRCGDTDVIAIPAQNTTVYFCVTITNQSQQQLTRHTVDLPQLGIANATITTTLPVNEELSITSGILQEGGAQVNLETSVSEDTTFTVTVTSSDGSVNFEDVATARVVVGQVAVTVEQTVGTNEADCATTDSLGVAAGTTVYYCLTIEGAGSLTIEEYAVSAPALDVAFSAPSTVTTQPLQLTAQQVREDYPPNRLETVVTEPFTNTVTVTARTAEGVTATDSAIARVVPGNVAATARYTVGTNPSGCASTNSLTVVTNTTVYYCIQLTNTGSLPLERHAITTTVNNQVLLATVHTQTVDVGETLVLTQAFDNQLARLISVGETNQLSMVSYTASEIPVNTQATATVSLGGLSFTLNKYARTDGSGCVNNAPLTITTQQDFYYCLIIRNTGQVPLTNFTVTEPAPTNINFTFDYTLGVGQTITLTNATLPSFGLGTLLGPFRTPNSITPGLTVVARTPAGASTQVSQSFQIIANIPTSTFTPVPTSTYTPTPTNTPIPTTTPTVPPTPTPTTVVISILPTATDPFEISSIDNPVQSGGQGDGNAFESPLEQQPTSPLETPTPFVDVVATDVAATNVAATNEANSLATATAVAATETVVAAAAATATAQALESAATQTAVALLPTATPTPPPTDSPTSTETPSPQAAAVTLAPAVGAELPGTGGAPFGGDGTADDYLTLLLTSFATSTVTLGWIWFLVGSVIFFAVAGMFAGLSFRQQEAHRYQMAGDDDEQIPAVDDLFASWPDPLDTTQPVDKDWTTLAAADPDYVATPADNPTSDLNADPNNTDPNNDDFWPASLR